MKYKSVLLNSLIILSIFSQTEGHQFKCEIKNPNHLMTIRKHHNFTKEQKIFINYAQCIWESLVIGRNVDGHRGLKIDLYVEPIENNVSGYAQIVDMRYYNLLNRNKFHIDNSIWYIGLTTRGKIILNKNYLYHGPVLLYTMIHEIGHLLGVNSDLWVKNHLYELDSGKYYGLNGVKNFNSLYHKSIDYLPILVNDNPGQTNSHWDDLNITDIYNRHLAEEIMSYFITDYNYISGLTLGVIKDNGYIIHQNTCVTNDDCKSGDYCSTGIFDMCLPYNYPFATINNETRYKYINDIETYFKLTYFTLQHALYMCCVIFSIYYITNFLLSIILIIE